MNVAEGVESRMELEKNSWSWKRPAFGRTIGMARWGWYGKPVIWFPTGGGDHLDCERFLMVRALSPLIEAGRIKINFPSGDGVGRMAPPGPPANRMFSPVTRSTRRML